MAAASGETQWTTILRKPESIAAAKCGTIAMSLPTDPDPPVSAYSEQTQQGQKYNWWCAAATLVETMNQLPNAVHGRTQDWAATELGLSKTQVYGTDKDVFHREINQHSGGFPYDRVNLAYDPTSTEISLFTSSLKVDSQKGVGVVGVAWEVPGGKYLAGHPTSQEIMHYFNLRGYSSSGSTSHYEDSATTVWAGVPAYSSRSTYDIVKIMGGKGYWW